MSSDVQSKASSALWYKDAIIYELHVKTFHDSNGDGIGDFRGLIEKLDYLQELGVTAIWLLPFYPSPLRDDGYDIADYYDVNPNYGTLAGFPGLSRRGARARTARHHRTGDQSHLRSKSVVSEIAPRCARFARARFVCLERYAGKIQGSAHHFQRFRDLELVVGSGGEGVLLAPLLFASAGPEFRQSGGARGASRRCSISGSTWASTACGSTPFPIFTSAKERAAKICRETHDYLEKLRAHVDANFQGRMLLAEANQWPEDAVAYFGKGDESHMNFHFPLMPRMFMSLQMEDRFPIIDILEQTPPIPENCQWAMFLRNHDELTLEMVTDEERDYMWRVYANDPTRAHQSRHSPPPRAACSRTAAARSNCSISCSSPCRARRSSTTATRSGWATIFISAIATAVRTPMQWSPDRNAGFSKANPQQLYLPITIDPEYHYEAINVENQQKNLSSLLWWMRRVIAMRKNFKAFSRGSLEFLYPENAKGARVSAPARRRNHSRRRQSLAFFAGGGDRSLALRRLRADGGLQSELFSRRSRNRPTRSRSDRTRITGLCFGRRQRAARASQERVVPTLKARAEFARLLADGQRAQFEREILPDYIRNCRWFGAKARTIREMRIAEEVPILGEENARNFGSSKSLTPTARRRPTRCRCRSRREMRPHAIRAVGAACGHCAVRWRRRKRFCTTRSGTRLSARQLFRAHGATAERLSGKAGELVGVAPPAQAGDRRKKFRRRRSSAPSKAIRRCCSRTNFS